jgi:uncharacterized ParB-like nuclease family protein
MIRLLLLSIILTAKCICPAQSFEGVLQIDYRTESGNRNAVDVQVKGDKFYIQKVFGGCERYNAYIYDSRTRTLSCLNIQNPRTALSMGIDKILDIYIEKKLKPGYQIHISHSYISTDASKKINGIPVVQKKGEDGLATYDIWVADFKIDYSDLIPVLRLLGFWGDA